VAWASCLALEEQRHVGTATTHHLPPHYLEDIDSNHSVFSHHSFELIMGWRKRVREGRALLCCYAPHPLHNCLPPLHMLRGPLIEVHQATMVYNENKKLYLYTMMTMMMLSFFFHIVVSKKHSEEALLHREMGKIPLCPSILR